MVAPSSDDHLEPSSLVLYSPNKHANALFSLYAWGDFGMPDQLTFVIDPTDEFSSLDLLVKSLEDIKRLLRDVDYAIYGRGSRYEQEWMVTNIRSSAPTITLTPQPERRQSVETVGMGLKSITEGIDYPPEHFTETSLDDLKKMRRLFQGRGRARAVSVLVDDEPVASIDEHIEQQANRVLSGGYHNLGSLQGRLDAINVHSSPTATIWDRVSGMPVRWRFPREETEAVKALLEQLVVVTGDIRFFSNGRPRSISNVVTYDEIAEVRFPEIAGFGAIPDPEVQEVGAARWLASLREME